jgi:thiol-disulfide isomerase/thioredoxin
MNSGKRIRRFLLAIVLGLASFAGTAQDGPAELRGVLTDGTPYDLAQHRGKVVMLNFWATWCPACRADWPVWQQAFEQYRGSGFEMVAVSIDRDQGAMEKFLKDHPYTVPVVWRFDTREKDSFAAIRRTPTTYFIGRDGKVAERRLGRISKSELDETIEAMLQR